MLVSRLAAASQPMRSMSTPETHCSGSFSISGYLTASHGITDLKCLWKFWRLFEAHPPWSSIRASANRMEQGGWCKRLWRKRSEMWPHECGQTRRLDWYCWVLWFAQNFSIYTNDAKKKQQIAKKCKRGRRCGNKCSTKCKFAQSFVLFGLDRPWAAA